MFKRSELKEKRNFLLWKIWLMLLGLTVVIAEIYLDGKIDVILGGTLIIFCFLSVAYRVLTYLFNQFLLLFFSRKKFKINRLKGRITPIYKIEEYIGFKISKYSVEYTDLKLDWSIPFSVLFQEQEYVLEGSYSFYSEDGYDIKKVTDISTLYESKDAGNKLKYVEKISAKTIKQQKINNLNKVFNENYK